MASPVIELRNVSVGFLGTPVLEGVNLSIERGDVLVLIGPSGSGKSTLLKLMAGLIRPSSGEFLINGSEWNTLPRAERRQFSQKTGMLFQKNALFDSLTAAENVAFPLIEVAGLAPEKAAVEVGHYLEAVGLAAARDLFPDEISGGMQKRLGIARAIAMKPEVIFYDDPTAGLDPITSRKIIQLIIDLQKNSGTTVVAVTNDMNRAYQMAAHIAMTVDRRLILCGNTEQTRRHLDPRVQQFIHGALHGPLTDEPIVKLAVRR